MKTIVLVTGRARSGKDTFISEVRKALPRPIMSTAISSIGLIKGGLNYILTNAGIDDLDLQKLSAADRQCLSDFKVALDRHYGFTDRYLNAILSDWRQIDHWALFYQVRELDNIQAIKARYAIGPIRAVSVLLNRENYPEDQPLADVERHYDPNQFDHYFSCATVDVVTAVARYFAASLCERELA